MPEGKLFNELHGFTWGEPVHKNCHRVKMPADWYLRDSSMRSDIVVLEIISPERVVVANVGGKSAEHAFSVQMWPGTGDKINLDAATIRNGYIIDAETILKEQLRDYRGYCTSVNGCREQQPECDRRYAKLKDAYKAAGKELCIEPIDVGKVSPAEGMLRAGAGIKL